MLALTLAVAILSACAAIASVIASKMVFKLNKRKLETEADSKTIREGQKQVLEDMSVFSKSLMERISSVGPQFVVIPNHQPSGSAISADVSLFDRRSSHFTSEKELLAKEVVIRIADLIEKNKNLFVILVLDAGSTIYPIFRQLCIHPYFQFDGKNAGRLKIITNNLRGVSDLIRYGRIGDFMVARTLFQCRILSGFANSQYEASLNDKTEKDLFVAKEEFETAIRAENPSAEISTMSIMTGNYISITAGILARDEDHLNTKSAMLEVAEKTYVLAPLGKLLPYSCSEINDLLEIGAGARYGTLPKWSDNLAKVTMVTTVRPDEYFPHFNPLTLNLYFAHIQREIGGHYKDSISITFDPMSDPHVKAIASITGLERAIREYELPHQNLRAKLIAKLQAQKSQAVASA